MSSNEIKDVVIDETGDLGGGVVMGHPAFPQVKNPGYNVDYPTCSEPGPKNKGCDAFAQCTMKNQGPFTVAFKNKSGLKSFCHCRNWMRSYQFKRGYVALGRSEEDHWEDCLISEQIDPKDKTKGYRNKRFKMKIDGVRYPLPDERHREPVAPEIKDVEIEGEVYGAESPEKPKGPVEGIKHGNRRKGNQVEASGSE